MWHQTELTLRPRPRGFHLITREVLSALPELAGLRVGLLHVFIQHTSASLTVSENASPDVRRDFERYFNHAVPDGWADFEHTLEGDDDMAAHIKASVLGPSLSCPLPGRQTGARAPGRACTCVSTATGAARADWCSR